MRKFNYITGLPRSGSTLLTNILVQNPKFHASTTSSLLDLLLQIRNNWNNLEGHKTYPNGQDKWSVIQSVLQAYHKTDKNIIFDKNRGWTNHIEFIEKVTGTKAKMIACVRNMDDIVSSFERLFRENRGEEEIAGEFSNPQMKNLDGRVSSWISDDGVIGRPYVNLTDAITRGLGDRILIFPYEQWTLNPDLWFKRLYDFIGETYYKGHDFNNVEQKMRENDAGYGWGPDLHKIYQGKITPTPSKSLDLLGQNWVSKLKDSEFWKQQPVQQNVPQSNFRYQP